MDKKGTGDRLGVNGDISCKGDIFVKFFKKKNDEAGAVPPWKTRRTSIKCGGSLGEKPP